MKGKKTKTRITAPHCLQLILPPLHTKNIWRLSVGQPSTSSYSPTLRVRQTHTIWKHTFSGPQSFLVLATPLVGTAWNRPLIGGMGGGLLCVSLPPSPSHPFSSILHGSTHLWGPHEAFVQIDGLWVALEQGYTECSHSFRCYFSQNHPALTVN